MRLLHQFTTLTPEQTSHIISKELLTESALESMTVIMVFTAHLRVLLGIILLSCVQSVVNENVDINTLSRIQRFFHYRYESSHGQYAVAINVPKMQCRRHFYPSNNNFLRNDQSDQVIPNSSNVYTGHEIITAGHSNNAHSEHLLMHPPNSSPLTHLMNRNNDGCVVFYTLNSPCINRCLNNRHRDNIIPGLDELQAYQGIKAFAYTYIYTSDQNKTNLREKLQIIANRVPLYRCNQQGCDLCGEPGTNRRVIDQCLN